MSAPLIHGVNSTLTASLIRQAVADDLSRIRQEDGLTWADIGRVLGKSEDQAAKYADGSAEIGIVAYTFGEREWKTRLTGTLRRLVHCSRPDAECDRSKGSKLLAAALAMSVALEDDDEITPAEVMANRATLEAARDAITGVLNKIKPRAA